MALVEVSYTFNACIEDVFDVLTDHGNYHNTGGFDHSELLAFGKTDKNGLGAVRELIGYGTQFIEDITAYEPPSHFEYQVRECFLSFVKNHLLLRFPLIHLEGRITLKETKDNTEVYWRSRFEVDLPCGKLIACVLQKRAEKSFMNVLSTMEKTCFKR